MAGGSLILIGGAFDMLDGALARHSGRATSSGAFLDSVVDRLSEAAILFGLLWWYTETTDRLGIILSYTTLVLSVLVSYLRARGEGLGLKTTIGLVQRPEHEAMFAPQADGSPAEAELYANLRDAETILLDGDHDVFGDGRVRILSAPGHTQGHQVLFLDLAETGPLVLSGDLYHFRLSREDRRVPTFNFDEAKTLASMEKIEVFVAETGATFWIEHDLALFETLDKAPAYYE